MDAWTSVSVSTHAFYVGFYLALRLRSVLAFLARDSITDDWTAYAPQMGARLGISHTQLNIVALAGNSAYLLFLPSYLTLFSRGIQQRTYLGSDSRQKGTTDPPRMRVHLSPLWIFRYALLL